jgi:hypothetical protein
MTESIASPMSRWRYGVHPQATDLRIRSLGRVYLQLGEALRLEMSDPGPEALDTVHLQYYIATELGPWALWLSGARDAAADSEAALRELTPPFGDEAQTGAAKRNDKGTAWGLRR